MNRISYSIILYLLSPIIWCYLLFRAIKAQAYREGFMQRLGLVPQAATSKIIVIHCASIGETRAAAPLIEKLLNAYADFSIIITTTTPTGKTAVIELFGTRVQHFYLPIDWPGSCKRFIKRIKPQIVILMETELWPNLLYQCRENKIPVLLANARMSKKSLAKYLRFEKLSSELFANVTRIAAQYSADKQRFLELGVADNKVDLVGNIKFDIDIPQEVKLQQTKLKSLWAPARPVWIAASIHPGEFDSILDAHRQLLKVLPDLLLIGVPRHPEKFAEFIAACKKHQLTFVCRSDNIQPDDQTRVVVGDTMGEMTLFCGVADLAYVGGSLIERGGHNPLEPIACGTPVLMGPHYYNFTDICESLLDKKVMRVVESVGSLTQSLETLLQDKNQLSLLSQSCLDIIRQNKGCADKILAQVNLLIGFVNAE